jgi:hypothetical protein
MDPVTTTITKILWQIWNGDTLTVQAVTQRVTEEDCKLTEIVPLGSVKYVFKGIDTREKVDNIIEEISSGKIK